MFGDFFKCPSYFILKGNTNNRKENKKTQRRLTPRLGASPPGPAHPAPCRLPPLDRRRGSRAVHCVAGMPSPSSPPPALPSSSLSVSRRPEGPRPLSLPSRPPCSPLPLFPARPEVHRRPSPARRRGYRAPPLSPRCPEGRLWSPSSSCTANRALGAISATLGSTSRR